MYISTYIYTHDRLFLIGFFFLEGESDGKISEIIGTKQAFVEPELDWTKLRQLEQDFVEDHDQQALKQREAPQ